MAEEYDVNKWGLGDQLRNQEELDDVHVRAYNKDKDEILDTVFISEAEGKTMADRTKDNVDAEARRRGQNISAQVKKVRGGYQVFTYRPKKKLCTPLAVS